jgi:beta-lactamase regulating signal transducer with metallopeptidase domain
MNIGLSIFLITVGAILAFAVNATVSGLDINVIGVILLVVGIGWLGLSLALLQSRRTRLRRGVAPSGAMVEERRVYNEPPASQYETTVYDEPLP